MEIKVDTYGRLTFQSIAVQHTGEPTLQFDGGGYRTARMVQLRNNELDDSLFNELNEFVSRMPKEKQDELYNCYASAESVFKNYDTGSVEADSIGHLNMAEGLTEIIHRIYELVLFEDLHDYIVGNRDLKIPPELSDSYNTDDKITPLYVARTYRLSEYIDLMAFCLGLRFSIPIWGPYLKISGVADGIKFKEYRAFELFAGCRLHACRAYERMDTYIRANTPEDEQTMATVMHFLSSEQIPTYNIATTMIRKLSIAPLSCLSERHHLMKILYGYATNRNKQLDLQLEPGLQDKKDRGVFDDDNSSVLCLFQMKEQMAAGDLTVFEVYIEDYVKAAQAIDATIPAEMVEACVQHTLGLSNQKWRSKDVQKSLVAWVLSPVISATTIPLLSRKTLMIAMGISQATLWHWGLTELAIMLTARIRPREEGEFTVQHGMKGLSKATLETLDALYPYKVPRDKKNPTGWSENVGVRGIETLHRLLAEEDWIPQCPQALRDLHPTAKYGIVEASSILREHLATLLIRLDDARH